MSTLGPNDPNDYTTLFGGWYWNGIQQTSTPTAAPIIVTYSFPATLQSYDVAEAGSAASTYGQFTTSEQTEAVSALQQWANASGIVFIQVKPGEGDINFGTLDMGSTGAGGMADNPGGYWDNNTNHSFVTDLNAGGDVFMNSRFVTSDANYPLPYDTLLHEIGHAIGLKHPDETGQNGVPENVYDGNGAGLTVMSTVGDGSTNDHQYLSLYQWDKDADAAIYGPAGTGNVYTASTGPHTNTVSTWSWNATTETLTQTAVGNSESITGTSVNDVITALGGTNYLYGLAGTNTLNGGPDTNFLYGGTGINTLNGHGSADSFYVSSTTTSVSEDGSGSAPELFTYVSYTAPVGFDYLQGFGQGLTLTANDDLANQTFGDGTFGTTFNAGKGADYMVGGAGNDTFNVGAGADYMFGQGGSNTFVFKTLADTNSAIGDFSAGTNKIDLSGLVSAPGSPSLNFIGTGPFTDVAGQVESFIDPNDSTRTFLEVDINGDGQSDFQVLLYNTPALTSSDLILSPACYCVGTRILTEHGEVAVEDLAVGDCVITVGGQCRPIKWIGTRAYAGLFADGNRSVLPVTFRAGSLGEGVPRRDLSVSPNHAMFIAGVLIQAADLVNGRSITQADSIETVRYVHVELENHDVILAEGAWSETFVDDDSRMAFHNAEDFYRRYPDAIDGPARFCAPRVEEGYELQVIRDRLAQRSGHAVSEPAPAAPRSAIQ